MSDEECDKVRPEPDLAFVDTEKLIGELAARHPTGCIIYLRGTEGDGDFYRRNFRGPRPRLVSMVTQIRKRLSQP